MPMGVPSSRWKIRAMPLTPTMGKPAGEAKLTIPTAASMPPAASSRILQIIFSAVPGRAMGFLSVPVFFTVCPDGRIYAAVPGTGREDIWILIH